MKRHLIQIQKEKKKKQITFYVTILGCIAAWLALPQIQAILPEFPKSIPVKNSNCWEEDSIKKCSYYLKEGEVFNNFIVEHIDIMDSLVYLRYRNKDLKLILRKNEVLRYSKKTSTYYIKLRRTFKKNGQKSANIITEEMLLN